MQDDPADTRENDDGQDHEDPAQAEARAGSDAAGSMGNLGVRQMIIALLIFCLVSGFIIGRLWSDLVWQ